ncbi:hypothetical protein [Pseudomonas asplenii]|uniref:hypothetical protein n=1 Tax=Pseudomonas asplenii TaxID=53407 RepID=UPI0006B5099F|nr:hypothetical protein [Pseudomonas fuscovaginae]KPA98234.1 hypothetical protein PF70_01632 [Pseudomonas fuscovaginae]
MLDLIYIVETPLVPNSGRNVDGSYQPNFTMGGRDGVSKVGTAIGGSAVATAAALGSFGVPATVIASALVGIPGVLSLFSKDPTEKVTEESAENQQACALAAYVAKHSFSPEEVKTKGYRFQPGHPIVGKAYRKHPLMEYPNSESSNLYIPSDSYDSILLEERESELIKLLVALGATKITITKKTSNKHNEETSGGLTVTAGVAGGGGAEFSVSNEKLNDGLDTREFTLSGKKWSTESRVGRENFLWLAYEPSWKAVVFAREYGGCLSASLEIKENTTFSTDKNLELTVKAKLAEVGAHAGLSAKSAEEKSYLVRVEFSPIEAIG